MMRRIFHAAPDDGAGGAGGQGSAGESLGMRANWPPEYRDHPDLKGYDKPGPFLKDVLEWKKAAATAIVPPGENATDEEREAFFEKLGAPKTAEEYAFEYPDGYAKDDAREKAFRENSKKAQLSKGQARIMAQGLAAYDLASQAARADEVKRRDQENLDALTKQYGADGLKKADDLATRALQHTAMPQGAFKKLVQAGLHHDPEMFGWLVKIGEAFSEDSFIRGGALPTPKPDMRVIVYPSMGEKSQQN